MSDAPSQAQSTIATLRGLGVEVDEVDAAVIEAATAQFAPAMEQLLEVDLSGIEHEIGFDPSRPPV